MSQTKELLMLSKSTLIPALALNSLINLFCYAHDAPIKKERFKIVPSVCLILRDNNKVLLQRRGNTGWYDNCYALVGGGAEKGETFVQTIIREAQEELGITLNANNLKLVQIIHFKDKHGNEWFNTIFEATSWEGEPSVAEPDKCIDLCWFDTEKLPENCVEVIPYMFKRIDMGEYFSEFGFD